MASFHRIAVPHRDVLEGNLSMDVFAADLWEVAKGRGPDEYRDAETFFKKTYLTEGLKNLLRIVEKRLSGNGGDPVIQIQTPFGGGKTHALIAMYHRAEEWNAKKVVLVGTAFSTKETLWGQLEKQLTGSIDKFKEQVAPGKEALRELLSSYQPVLILMDEVLEYASKASGVEVGDSTLFAQTVAFMQELTESVSTLEKASLVITLPSSVIEHYDENAERLFQQLQKVAGRIEKIYTPVQENEITKVIRSRLFSSRLNEDEAKAVVDGFVEYAESEGLIPVSTLPSEYRDKFLNSYPFLPEVVEILYHRWGSFPSFQRTRGVLRLLALVIHSLKDTEKEYISLADFDLKNHDLREELIKPIGSEYNSVIGQDITGDDAGAKKVDNSLPGVYQGHKLGTRAATTIFLYSFSGGRECGATLAEIKRAATTTDNPASVVAEATEQLKGKLFYLQNVGEKYFFSNEPNLNRILLNYKENIGKEEIEQFELELLRESIDGGRLKVFIWEKDSNNIADSEDLKLLILKEEDKELINKIFEKKGKTPRVYRNTLFFLYPLEEERVRFDQTIRRARAFQYIDKAGDLELSEDQKKEVKAQLKKLKMEVKEAIRRLYRIVVAPSKEEFNKFDLGIPTFGEDKGLDSEVYDKLRAENEILERTAPLFLKEKYLSGKDYEFTEKIYQSTLKTPGEPRPISKNSFEEGICKGVAEGLFGIGELEDEEPICRYYKEGAMVSFSESEVIIKEDICKRQMEEEEKEKEDTEKVSGKEPRVEIGMPVEEEKEDEPGETKEKVTLSFILPKGKVSDLMGVMILLQSKFDNLKIDLEATGGSISKEDYEDKIKEAFRQMGIDLEQER